MTDHLRRLPDGFPNFKGKKVKTKLTKRLRAAKKRELDELVLRNMRLVRLEDQYCRVPDCGCRKFIDLEVAHTQHRGAGGNPTGDRSDPKMMVLTCRSRHRTSRISIDAGTLRPVPLTKDGTRGPCAWEVDRRALTMSRAQMGTDPAEWVEFAREAWPHVVLTKDEKLIARILEVR